MPWGWAARTNDCLRGSSTTAKKRFPAGPSKVASTSASVEPASTGAASVSMKSATRRSTCSISSARRSSSQNHSAIWTEKAVKSVPPIR